MHAIRFITMDSTEDHGQQVRDIVELALPSDRTDKAAMKRWRTLRTQYLDRYEEMLIAGELTEFRIVTVESS